MEALTLGFIWQLKKTLTESVCSTKGNELYSQFKGTAQKEFSITTFSMHTSFLQCQYPLGLGDISNIHGILIILLASANQFRMSVLFESVARSDSVIC